ncbi:MAG: hypothetical protein JST50_04845 [Bacteroidetes bacterium]|jgi:hypothetical protein|nr:hypothetical protein [Bacteroidota bacterium]
MKRKFAGLALIAIFIISVTSGCIVREDDYHHYRHHDRYDHDRYDHDYYNHDYHDHD